MSTMANAASQDSGQAAPAAPQRVVKQLEVIGNISPHGDFVQSLQKQTTSSTRLLLMTLGGGLLVINSFLVELFPAIFPRDIHVNLLAFVGAVLLAAPLVYHSVRHLMIGQLRMDELAAIAILAAMASGMYREAGVVAFFMVLANLIETRTALGARMAVEGLIRITPTRAARLIEQDGQLAEQQVEAARLSPGDLVRVRPGDTIPADGEIANGASTVNQASITGESLPAEKQPGDEVFSGTINLTGMLDIRVTKAGADTTLGRVKQLILEAEQTKIPLMRLIDRYISWYTPIVLMLAGMVWFFNMDSRDALTNAITMLVIACPCALVLATPTAMVAAISAAARLGILVKNVSNLEAARKVNAIMFDKTGTLTTGRLMVTRMLPAPGVQPAELLRLAASLEALSRHPVARAVAAVARKAQVPIAEVTGFEEVSGQGVRGTVNGRSVVVGRLSFLRQHGINVDTAERLDGPLAAPPEGLSLLYVGVDQQLAGWIGLEDKTRDEARTALDELRSMGVTNLTMVTGDRWPVARKVAAEMGCTEVLAEVLPADKLAVVRRLKSEGRFVAVVGDGVNDAPALASGDVGIAMGAAGSDIAIHSASIALMNSDLRRLPYLIRLSRRTTNVIYQNLFFGMLFIIIFMVLASLGYLTPIGGAMLAAFLHNIGSLAVIMNSARIVRFGEQLLQEAPAKPPEDDLPEPHIRPERVAGHLSNPGTAALA